MYKKLGYVVGIFWVIFLLIIILFFSSYLVQSQDATEGVGCTHSLFSGRANVRSGSSLIFNVVDYALPESCYPVYDLYEGTELDEPYRSWVKIKGENNQGGWISANLILVEVFPVTATPESIPTTQITPTPEIINTPISELDENNFIPKWRIIITFEILNG